MESEVFVMAQFTNQAQLSYNDSIKNSNIAVGEILEVLSASKTAVENAYGQNDRITYVISIVNSGTAAFTGLTVTDNLGAYTEESLNLVPLTYVAGTIRYYSNGVLQAAPAVTAGPPLTISGITVPAGGNVILLYETKTNAFASPIAGGSISNSAVISGSGITPITVTETVEAVSEPELCITKSVSPVPVTENGILTYTFLIQNSGNKAAEAADQVVVTDIFQPVLADLSVTLNGTAWTEGTEYTYQAAAGEFVTTAGKITVPAASYTQDMVSGAWVMSPGVSVLTVSGRV